MRSKDKTLLADIEKFVSNYTDRFGISPTMQEVADGVGSSKATVQRYITQLCAIVPDTGTENFRPASTLEVATQPPIMAARAP